MIVHGSTSLRSWSKSSSARGFPSTDRDVHTAHSRSPHRMPLCLAQYGQPDEPFLMALTMVSGTLLKVCLHSSQNHSQGAGCVAIRRSWSARGSLAVAPYCVEAIDLAKHTPQPSTPQTWLLLLVLRSWKGVVQPSCRTFCRLRAARLIGNGCIGAAAVAAGGVGICCVATERKRGGEYERKRKCESAYVGEEGEVEGEGKGEPEPEPEPELGVGGRRERECWRRRRGFWSLPPLSLSLLLSSSPSSPLSSSSSSSSSLLLLLGVASSLRDDMKK